MGTPATRARSTRSTTQMLIRYAVVLTIAPTRRTPIKLTLMTMVAETPVTTAWRCRTQAKWMQTATESVMRATTSRMATAMTSPTRSTTAHYNPMGLSWIRMAMESVMLVTISKMPMATKLRIFSIIVRPWPTSIKLMSITTALATSATR